MSTLETRLTKLPLLPCSDMSPELEIPKLKAISGMSHTQEETCGLEDQMPLSFNSRSQLRIHSALLMLPTLRELLRPQRSSPPKVLRRLMP